MEPASIEAFVKASIEASECFFSVKTSIASMEASMEAFMNVHAKNKSCGRSAEPGRCPCSKKSAGRDGSLPGFLKQLMGGAGSRPIQYNN